ncbi:hypothetical protein [Sphingomonas sp.]|uniref:hypothetical protein n=1 Tax=Sphingomonas sp. TaxID=28214 RepID=UPI003F6E537C
MSGTGTFATTLSWMDGDDEIEADVRVVYSRYAGYRGSYYEPPEEASVEIISITPADPTIRVPDRFDTDDDLLAECMSDWSAEVEDAREWRAQARRDDLLMERLESRNAVIGGCDE